MSIFDSVREKLFKGGTPEGEMQEPQDQPKEDQELAGYVKKYFDDVRQQATRVAQEGIWMTNIAYLLGYDSVYYDSSLRQFRPSANSAGSQFLARDRVRSNLILPAVQNRLARMLKAPPRYEVQPNSMDEDDKEAARLGEEVIGHVWDKQHINRKRIDLGMWLQQCGHSYMGVCWDDQLGEPLVDPMTDEATGYEGGQRIDVVSAFEGFPDPLAKSFDECTKFGRAKVRKLDYFRTHYPERGALVKEEGAWLLSIQYEMRINTINSAGPAASGQQEQMKGCAIELSYYEARSAKHPKGRHVIVANGVVLKNDELPVGEIPYAKFDDIVVGGKFNSESVITHARPLQDQYNRSLVKTSQWVNKCLTGKYIAARGHGLIQEAINDQSGEVVEYDPVPQAPEPKAMSIPTIPGYIYDERKLIKGDMYEIFGLSEVSRGQLPSASIPAIGIQLLLEQDETRIGVETEQHEHSWARIGQLILKYEAKYAVTTRKLKRKGENGLKIREYNGESLKSNFDVTVIRGSTVPNSKVIHRQEIMNLYSQGLLGEPTDPAVRDKVLAMLQYGEVSEAWQDHHLDKMQIERDLDMIEQGEPPPVDAKDNHVLHMVDKNRYRKSEKWYRLSPISQQILQENIQAHSQFAIGQMNPQLATPPQMPESPEEMRMMQGQPPMGGPPGPGGGPPPPGAPPPGAAEGLPSVQNRMPVGGVNG